MSRRTFVLAAAVFAAFAATLLARFPAAWALKLAPAGLIECSEPVGTLWKGRCTQAAFRGTPLGALTWDLRAASLLRARIGGHATVQRQGATAEGDFEAGFGGALDARNLRTSFELDPALVPGVPPNVRGRVSADMGSLALRKGRIARAAGRIEVRGLRQLGAPEITLGDYELVFDGEPLPDGALPGRLRDLGGGPLGIEATLTLTPEPGYLLEGLVTARPDTPAELARQLAILGSPDASGRRPFSVAGTF